MRKNYLYLIIILIITAAGAAVTGALTAPPSKEVSVGAYFSDAHDYEALTDGKEKRSFDPHGILFNGHILPCDAAKETFFIPQDPGEKSWTGALTAGSKGDMIRILDDAGAAGGGKKADCIEKGHRFRTAVIGSDSYMEAYIVFTGLPVILITYDDGPVEGKEDHAGTMRVTDPCRDTYVQADCTFHVRGNTSVLFDKKSYRIELHDSIGRSQKESILGLRTDDDWILNSLSTDVTLSREKVSYDLWEKLREFDKAVPPAPSMEYAEVFMNDRYAGVYGLMFPVDGKLMEMQQGDLLYKIRTWMEEMDVPGKLTDYNGEREVLNTNGYAYALIEYPGKMSGPYLWDPLEAYQDFVFKDRNTDRLAGEGVTIDKNAFVFHELFCEMTRAADNTWKNLYLAARRQKDGTYVLTETIWDLNYTFGDEFVWDPDHGNTRFNANSTDSFKLRYDRDYGFTALETANPSVKENAADKWKMWRENGIGPDLITQMFEKERKHLVESGAIKRDRDLWKTAEGGQEYMTSLHKWIAGRFAFLDSLYEYAPKAEQIQTRRSSTSASKAP